MKFIADCHLHTLVSGHAYSTIDEYAKEASKKKLKTIAITDHAPNMPGSCHIYYFENLKVVPKSLHGVKILKGVELNIIDYDGTVDLPDRLIKNLDISIASFHSPCLANGGIELNTKAYINTMKNPNINIIGHPDDSRIPVDYKLLVENAAKYNKILEVNNTSLSPTSFRENAHENYKVMLDLCIKYNVKIIVNTDSHFHTNVGNFDYASKFLDEINFPKELVINTNNEKLLKQLMQLIK